MILLREYICIDCAIRKSIKAVQYEYPNEVNIAIFYFVLFLAHIEMPQQSYYKICVCHGLYVKKLIICEFRSRSNIIFA
jgi:hypothetical protein